MLTYTINGGLMSGANGQRIGALVRVDPNTGAIDPTWSPDPTLTGNGFLGVAEAPDGKIYYSTTLTGDLADSNPTDPAVNRLVRLNTDGTRDTSFNSPIFAFTARFLGVQTDGKIIVCSGGIALSGVPPADSIVQTVRLNTDGSLDTTFQSPNFQFDATDPPASVASGNYYDAGVFGNPVIDPTTGKIYFCGTFRFVNGEPRKSIVRCNADGTLDSSFVPTGLIGGSTQLTARAMVLQTGGKVVLGGNRLQTAAGGSTRYALLRFNDNGTLDPAFTLVPTTNSTGTALVPGYFGPRDIHMLPGGNILTSDIRVLRFLADGTLDSTFTPLDYSSPFFTSNNGRIAGFRFDVNANTGEAYLENPYPLYARLGGVPVPGNITKLTSDGTIDTQFISPVVESEDFAPDVQIAASGAVYVSGHHTDFGNAANATITRLRANGTRDPAYSLDTLPFSDKQAAGFALLPDSSAYAVYFSGSFNGSYSFSNLARLLPTGALDTNFHLSSALQTAFSINAFDGNDTTKLSLPQISSAPSGKAYLFSSGDPQATVNADGNQKPTRINTGGTEDTGVLPLGFPVGEVTRDSSGITGGSTGYLQRLAQTADGGFIVLASVAPFPTFTGDPYNYKVIKLLADGSLDPNFDSPSLTSTASAIQDFPVLFDPVTGITSQPPNGFYIAFPFPVSSAAMLPDGSVLLAGNFQLTGNSTTYSLAKLTPAGTLDTSFSPPVPGPENTARPTRPALITNVRVAPGGKIWVLGRFDTFGGNSAPGVARLNPGGSLDSTFALTGVSYYDSFGDYADVVFANSNSAYLVGTFRRPGEPMPFAVTRIRFSLGSLGNISTRGFVQTGDNVMIGGFIINGSGQKKVLLRAIGPSLTQYGVANALADPVIELHDSSGALIASNDNWTDASNHQAITDSGLAPSNSSESAILMSLDPGPYSAIVHGVSNGTGVALVEAYDLDPTATSKLGNISTRAFVQTGDNVMIGGLIISGTTSENVLVRAIGPSLTQYGIANALADPTLELHDTNGSLVATNDNWKDTQQAEIVATGLAPSNDAESAIKATLAPNPYTAIVVGKNHTVGVALVEVYGLN